MQKHPENYIYCYCFPFRSPLPTPRVPIHTFGGERERKKNYEIEKDRVRSLISFYSNELCPLVQGRSLGLFISVKKRERKKKKTRRGCKETSFCVYVPWFWFVYSHCNNPLFTRTFYILNELWAQTMDDNGEDYKPALHALFSTFIVLLFIISLILNDGEWPIY